MQALPQWTQIALGGLSLTLIAAFGGIGYVQWHNSVLLTQTRQELASTTANYESTLAEQGTALSDAEKRNLTLINQLAQEQRTIASYKSQVGDLSSTVDTLTKLTTIDPQLLAKYSKVYFLNENYIPAKLERIDPAETYNHERVYSFDAEALPFLNDLIADATANNTGLLVVSAYRSFGEQSSLKASYKLTYGAGTANSFSADQGYSEHQLGTAVDFTTKILGANFTSFDKSDAYDWLRANAYRYGFVISYPKSNTYYTYEPWHWRFVGIALATKLHNDDEYFYEADQRTINSYLVTLFDEATTTASATTTVSTTPQTL